MPPAPDSERSTRLKAYWRANVRVVSILLVIWFVASFGLGILGVVPLNKIKMGGFPLGFWFAQQGSIYIFVCLVVAYALIMERLDRKFDVDEKSTPKGPTAAEVVQAKAEQAKADAADEGEAS